MYVCMYIHYLPLAIVPSIAYVLNVLTLESILCMWLETCSINKYYYHYHHYYYHTTIVYILVTYSSNKRISLQIMLKHFMCVTSSWQAVAVNSNPTENWEMCRSTIWCIPCYTNSHLQRHFLKFTHTHPGL